MIRMVSAFSLGRGATGAAAERRRNLIAISIVSFLASVGFMIVMPFLPVLLREVTGGDAASVGLWLGLAISVAPLMTALTAPIWTTIGERFGRKAMLERSVVCIGIGIGLLAIASSAWHVVALRAVVGGLGGVSVAALAAITATTPRRDLGPAVGTLQAAQTAGAMFGPLVGGVLGSMLGMREAFVLSSLIFVVSLGLIHVLFTDMPTLVEPPARPTSREQTRSAEALGVGIAVAVTAAFLLQFIEGGLLILFPIELERLGVSDDSFAMVFGVGLSLVYLAATVSAAVAGRLTNRWSAMTMMAGMAGLAVLVLVPMLFVTAYWQFIGLRVLLALLAGAGPTLAYAAVAASCSPERRGQMVSLTSSAATLGWAASPLIAGALIQISPSLLVLMNVGIFGIVALLLIGGQRGLFDPLATLVQGRSLSFPRVGLSTLRPSLAGPRGLLDRLHAPVTLMPARKAQQARFTTDEVVAALTGRGNGPRAQSALNMAAQTARWMPNEPRRAFREVGRYADRVPAILFQMRNGGDPELIGRELSPLGGSWPVRRTVEIAADLIARELNR